jgi:hypothetical protein
VAVGGGNKIKPPPGILWSPNAIPKTTNAVGGGEGESNDKADPFAFFKRYWYIFLLMLLMNLTAAGQPQKAASGGVAVATGSVARAAAPTASGGCTRQRRGKKV